MQLILTQEDIELALLDYVNKLGLNTSGKEVGIALKSVRVPSVGYNATVTVLAAGSKIKTEPVDNTASGDKEAVASEETKVDTATETEPDTKVDTSAESEATGEATGDSAEAPAKKSLFPNSVTEDQVSE